MNTLDDCALKFIRWGLGLSVLGLVTGYLPLGHYLMVGAIPSCPAAPVHGHTILLGFVGMPLFGLIYQALPAWMGAAPMPLGLVRAHLQLAVAGVLGVCVNGTLGYEVITHMQPRFYYSGVTGEMARNIWFGIDGVFLTLYGVGCAILLFIVMTKTAYANARAATGAPAWNARTGAGAEGGTRLQG
jgi:hypothetical protein